MYKDFVCISCKISLSLKIIKNKNKSFNHVQLFVNHGLHSPCNSPGQNTGVSSLSLLGDLPDPGIEPVLLHCKGVLYQLSYQRSP